jgi:nephrocystin-3
VTQKSVNQDRQIRVFISSTFRDMQAERNLLVKKIFPQLRKICEERSVTWTEVDLRWGITTEQAAEGKVLPLCLEEIQRCRPYFIGLLGERYGWVPEPNSIPAELLKSQPWLAEYLNHSVTELEILHGVLTDKNLHDHAYFYFRDREYVDAVPANERSEFVPESPEASSKLSDLKRRIRNAAQEKVCQLREFYTEPEQLGEWILEDFTRLIDRLYPKAEAPEPLSREAALHEAYARNRRIGFVGRDDLINQINEHAAALHAPLVLTGESGCGKSALLAEWVSRWRETNPDDLVIQHFIGSTSNSSDWQSLVRRLIGDIKLHFDLIGDLPKDDTALSIALSEWMAKAAGRGRVVLVLDALNQLEENGAAKQLGWLPGFYPENFRLVVSALPDKSLDALRKRSWPELNVPIFTSAEIIPTALTYFRIFGKTPSPEVIKGLESTPAAMNPLYLRAVLDELRQFGSHEELETKMQEYLTARNPSELFDKILTRWEQDFGQNEEDSELVRRALSLIACSRYGLSESELRDLLGAENEPLPHHHWAPFYLAAENALSQNSGLLRFGHEYLRNAVQKRWLSDKEVKYDSHYLIANYFYQQDVGSRMATELPWQLKEMGAEEDLKKCLLDFLLAMEILDISNAELLSYWIWLGEERNVGKYYVDIVKTACEENDFPPDVASPIVSWFAEFLTEAAIYPSAAELCRYSLELDEQLYPHPSEAVAGKVIQLATILIKQARPFEAEANLLRAIEIYKECTANVSPELVRAMNSLAKIQQERQGAEDICRKAFSMAERLLPSYPELVAECSRDLGTRLANSGKFALAESLLRRALEIDKGIYGSESTIVANDYKSLSGALITADRFVEADEYINAAIKIIENVYGQRHPELARYLDLKAEVTERLGREEEATSLRSRAEKIRSDVFTELDSTNALNQALDPIIPGDGDVGLVDAYKLVIATDSFLYNATRVLGFLGIVSKKGVKDLGEMRDRLSHLVSDDQSGEKKKTGKYRKAKAYSGISGFFGSPFLSVDGDEVFRGTGGEMESPIMSIEDTRIYYRNKKLFPKPIALVVDMKVFEGPENLQAPPIATIRQDGNRFEVYNGDDTLSSELLCTVKGGDPVSAAAAAVFLLIVKNRSGKEQQIAKERVVDSIMRAFKNSDE